ncbi:NUDIX domain-containing protein [Streptococcus sp. ZY19097]|uniref:NUDIX domain-containing protein n=1 Tax=Streptococcus sp. ZY19097 TaxID=3231906 RepID=UPI0034584BE5
MTCDNRCQVTLFLLTWRSCENGELAEDAVLRELHEELEIEASVIRPLWLSQSFFNEETSQECFHELCFYFLIDISQSDLLSLGAKFRKWESHKWADYEWLTFEELERSTFYPEFLKKEIVNLPEHLTLRTN